MKQIIEKNSNGGIWRKYYLNHLNKKNGMLIWYFTNGNLFRKTNYVNGKRFGLDQVCYYNDNGKPKEITYFL